MKDIRPQFTEEEYAQLRTEADRLGISLKQLVRDRALGIETEDQPLCSTRLLCAEIAKYRKVLNNIILREIEADVRLYEEDIIRMEMSVAGLENVVTNFLNAKLKGEK